MPNKLSIIDMHKLAESNNGKCLSNQYINNRIKLKWICKEGHEFLSKPNDIQRGHWCPYCAGLNKKILEDMHLLAKNKNGKCLSKEYVNSKTKMIWQCDKAHIFLSKPNDVQQGHWCPKCSRTRRK